MKFSKILSYNPFKYSISKTIYYNLKLLPLKEALKIPILVYPGTSIRATKDNILFPKGMSFGMITLGIPLTHFVDSSEKTLIIANGLLEFKGRCVIGSGSKIAISKPASLKIGSNFNSTGHLKICCEHDIIIGDECMFSWDITIIDTDYHPIISEGEITNAPKPIKIGNHVWIGFNSSILKGVNIADNCIISTGSTVRRSLETANSVYGMATKMIQELKHNVSWTKDVF